CGCYELTHFAEIAGLHQAGIIRLVDDQRLPGERWLILDGCPYAVPVLDRDHGALACQRDTLQEIRVGLPRVGIVHAARATREPERDQNPVRLRDVRHLAQSAWPVPFDISLT